MCGIVIYKNIYLSHLFELSLSKCVNSQYNIFLDSGVTRQLRARMGTSVTVFITNCPVMLCGSLREMTFAFGLLKCGSIIILLPELCMRRAFAEFHVLGRIES